MVIDGSAQLGIKGNDFSQTDVSAAGLNFDPFWRSGGACVRSLWPPLPATLFQRQRSHNRERLAMPPALSTLSTRAQERTA
jgi:hypothetical protein